jgi:hypothetical protein
MQRLRDVRTEISSLADASEATKDKALAIIFDLYATGELDYLTVLATKDSSLELEFTFANGHIYMMTIKEDSKLLELLLALEKDMQRYVYSDFKKG